MIWITRKIPRFEIILPKVRTNFDKVVLSIGYFCTTEHVILEDIYPRVSTSAKQNQNKAFINYIKYST